jgi:hypothetical protein
MSQLKNMQDEDLPIWLPRLAVHGGPRFLQIADALQAAMVEGSLKPGDRLPTQRQLAAQLDVDLTTITRAYDEARRRNLLEGRGARGTYVAAPKVELNAILDLSMNTPPPPDGVDFDDMLKQGLSQVLMTADNDLLMTYHLAGGSEHDRKAGAKWLAPMFGHLDSRQIIVCPGAQAAIAALILALTEPGDVILAEPMSYPGLRAAATQFGRHIIAVEADKHGMVPEMFEEPDRHHHSGTTPQRTRQHREALQCAHRRGRSLLASCRCPATTTCHVCPGTGGLHLKPVEMPDTRLACRLRAITRSARTRTFPGRAKIICADDRSSDGRTGHAVDPRRFG